MENWLKLTLFCLICHGISMVEKADGTLFSVLDYGAKGNPANDDTKAFQAAWTAACAATGVVKYWVPKGTYYLSPLKYSGPCKDVTSFIFQVEGTLKATTDLNKFGNDQGWFEFVLVNHLTLTGGGTFDGQGAQAWPYNKCPKQRKCKILPTSIKFLGMNQTTVKRITSLNSKFFHMSVANCQDFKASDLTISAPEDSPNTDGIHLFSNTGVFITSSSIETGDDCISIGGGNRDVKISGITCGPGHGISVGSLGRMKQETDVQGVIVRDCTFLGTLTGVRIKTWADSVVSISASDMLFENLVMRDVQSPIMIDQNYCPYVSCATKKSSTVQLSNIRYTHITGTSSWPEAVILHCSQGHPCRNVTLNDINLKHNNSEVATTSCLNIKAKFSGNVNPPPCPGGSA